MNANGVIVPERPYYIRLRGGQVKQLSGRMVIQKVRESELGRHDELSEDGRHWVPAGTVRALFPDRKERNRRRRRTTVEEPVETQRAETANASDSQPESESSVEAWWIAREGVTAGPYSHSQVVSWVSENRLTPSDYVRWPGQPDWVSIDDAQRRGMLPDASRFKDGPAKNLAFFSFLLSLAGCCVLPIVGLYAGVACGHLALDRMRRRRGSTAIKRAAYAGLSIGYVGIVLSIIIVILLCIATALRPRTETRFWYWYSEHEEIRHQTSIIPITQG